VRSRHVETRRLRMHLIESGPQDGVPVLLIHGVPSSCRIFEHLMPSAPDHLRLIAPDMRSFGASEHVPIDATRGLEDWADDIAALLEPLAIDEPAHLVGWSTGGAAIATYAITGRPAASLTLVGPVSPYGWAGVRLDGTPCFDDFAGSGGGMPHPELVLRMAAKDRSRESARSPRVVLQSIWAPGFQLPPDREEILLEELLKARTGVDGYPGDAVPSPNWPGTAPGSRGIMNALSPKYCNWTDIVAVQPKPPILWIHGSADVSCADGAAFETGTRGQRGEIPGWPGPDAFPPQPMVTQTRTILERYRAAGGHVRMEWLEGAGHAPHIDAEDRFRRVFFGFLDAIHRVGAPDVKPHRT
jgi:pimeloyl-ACP methyl ester carboxylesterase